MKAEPKWYVAQVLTGSEAETARRLTEAGMEAIAPVQVLHERRHGVWRLMRRTVFPGYVFVRVALIPRTYYHIQRQPQVVRLLGGAAPEAVPEEEMAAVLLFARSGRDFGGSCGERSNGETVITSGPLTALQERIVKVNPRGRRATVELTVLGEARRIEVGLVVGRGAPCAGTAPAE